MLIDWDTHLLMLFLQANFDESSISSPAQDLRYAGPDVQEHIIGVLRKYHDNPPVEAMCEAISSHVDKDLARDILFFPQEQHMSYYVKILKRLSEQKGASQKDSTKTSTNSLEDRSDHLKALFFNVLQLWHSRQWILARAFIVYGGLQALLLLQRPHLDSQIRWRSIEVHEPFVGVNRICSHASCLSQMLVSSRAFNMWLESSP